MRPSLKRDVLWYTNVRLSVRLPCRPSVCLSVRSLHMSRSNLRTPWPIHFKFHRVIGIDGLTFVYFMVKFRIFILELWDFIHQIVDDFSYVML